MTLTDFLLARIAEDEERATWQHRLLCMRTACDRDGCIWDDEEEMAAERVCTCGYPTRVLAECEAKRRLVDWSAPVSGHERVPTDRPGVFDPREVRYVNEDGEDVLRYLAMPYSDHPDYRDEWRP